MNEVRAIVPRGAPEPVMNGAGSRLRPTGDCPTIAGDYAMFLREREYSARLEKLLSRAVALLDMETHRRECAGEDVAHIRAFIREARSV